MNNNEQQQPKLTDEEVWLRAYLSTSDNAVYRTIIADSCLKDFKQRFRQNERTYLS